MKTLLAIILISACITGCKNLAEGTTYFTIFQIKQTKKGVKYTGFETTPGRIGYRSSFWSDSVQFQVGDTIYLNLKP